VYISHVRTAPPPSSLSGLQTLARTSAHGPHISSQEQLLRLAFSSRLEKGHIFHTGYVENRSKAYKILIELPRPALDTVGIRGSHLTKPAAARNQRRMLPLKEGNLPPFVNFGIRRIVCSTQ
jgi:hypothetical protein